MSETFQGRKLEDLKTITTFQFHATYLHNIIHYSLTLKPSLKNIDLRYVAATKCFKYLQKALLMLHIDKIKP